MADKQATFGIKVQADSNADLAALSVEELKKQLLASQEAVKNYNSSLRGLRGSSDEVKAAKSQLKAAVDAERDAISRTTLALGKQGLSLNEVTKGSNGAATATKGLGDAVKQVGGPVQELSAAGQSLGKILTTAVEDPMAALVVAAAAGALAIKGLADAFVGAVVGTTKFVIEEGSALRTMGLFREAALGSSDDARRFGNQIDLLSGKIATPKTELNDLAVSLSKSLRQSRVSGQGIVDTFNAVAVTSAAMGKETGAAIENIITRGKQWGKIGISPAELRGAGIAFKDVAQQLATNLGIGLKEAQAQLLYGRVNIDAGAKAIRDVVETRFGAVNAKRLLDIKVIADKFHESLANLTKGVDMDRILRPIKMLADQFADTTVSGQALKTLINGFGQLLGVSFEKGAPVAKSAILSVEIALLQVEIYILKNKKAIGSFVDDIVTLIPLGVTVLKGMALTAGGLLAPFLALKATVEAIGAGWRAIHGGGSEVKPPESNGPQFGTGDYEKTAYQSGLKAKESFSVVGEAMGEGLKEGLERSAPEQHVKSMVERIKDTVKGGLGIHSPSTVFKDYGRSSAQGFSLGVDAEAPRVNRSLNQVIAAPSINRPGPTSQAATARQRSGPAKVDFNVHFPGVQDGEGAAAALTSSSFQSKFTDMIESLNLGAAIPVQTSSAGVL